MENKALDIAKYIFDKGYKNNIKLNKLLYLSYGFYAGFTKKELFDEPIEAWQYGPVVPSVYKAFKVGHLDTYEPTVELNEEQKHAIDHVLTIYGERAPFLLVELTHEKNSPWDKHYQKGEKNIEIEKQDIIDYFTTLVDKINRAAEAMTTDDFRQMMRNLAKT